MAEFPILSSKKSKKYLCDKGKIMDTTKLETLLETLLQEVSLLTVSTKVDALKRFKADFLTSDLRKQAYEYFDGSKTLKEISDITGLKQNSIQIFAQQLVEKDLIDVAKQGNNKLYSKSISKIAVYYAELDLQKEEINNG